MNRRLLIIIASVAGCLFLVVILVAALMAFQTGTLTLTVTPTDSVIKLDGSKTVKAGDIKLSPGDHVLSITHDGYTPGTVSLHATTGDHQTRAIALVSTADTLSQKRGEADAGRQAATAGDAITLTNPILDQLPHNGGNFKVTYGRSIKYPGNAAHIALYVYAKTAADRTDAQNWLKSQNVDIASYEIIYQTP
jgi:hypothetical protein